MNNLKRAEQAALLYMQTNTDLKLLPQAMRAQAAEDFEAGYASALEVANTEKQFALRSIVQAFNFLDGQPGLRSYDSEKAIEILRYAIERLK